MATSGPGSSGGAATLDQLVALGDEMAALVRAGVPLERGLVETGGDLPGRLGAIARDLGGRLERGDRLPVALGRSDHGLPDVFAAVAEAGLRSGRLSSALEGLASLARSLAEARTAVTTALVYPLMVLTLAYGLAVGFVVAIAPRLAAGLGPLGLPPMPALGWLARAGESAAYWAPVPPILFALFLLCANRSLGSLAADRGPAGRLLGRLPILAAMIRDHRAAHFGDLLALLVEHRTPLAEAVEVAASATGDRRFREAAARLAGRVRDGDGPAAAGDLPADAFPPLLAWLLTSGAHQGDLAAALRQASATYRRRARARGDLLRFALPAVLMLALGATAVFFYGLLLFVPLSSLLDGLALPQS